MMHIHDSHQAQQDRAYILSRLFFLPEDVLAELADAFRLHSKRAARRAPALRLAIDPPDAPQRYG